MRSTMLTENVLATVLSVFSGIAAVILVICFGKFDRVCDFEFVYGSSETTLSGTRAYSFDAILSLA